MKVKIYTLLFASFALAGVFFLGAHKASADNISIEEKLAKKSFSYKLGKTFKKSLSEFSELAGIKIVVDWKLLEKAGIKPDKKVKLRGIPTKFSDILEIILLKAQTADTALGWYIHEGKIYVTTQELALDFRKNGKFTIAASDSDTNSSSSEKKSDRVTLTLNKTPFKEMIEAIRKQLGINIYVNWNQLEEIDVSSDSPITLDLKNITYAQVLDLALSQLTSSDNPLEQVHWVVENGIIMISSGADLNKTFKTKIINIADLLVVIPQFQGPRIDIKGIGDDKGGSIYNDDNDQKENKEESNLDQKERLKKNLIKMIKNSIPADFWKDNGGEGTIQIVGNRLIIRQSLLGFKLLKK